jgi:hypothetical protein
MLTSRLFRIFLTNSLSQRDLCEALAARLMIAHVWLGRFIRVAWTARLWELLSLPNCAMEVLVHARWHGLVVLIGDVFAYHLRIQEAITANTAMPLVTGEHVRTPLGALRVVLGIGHFNDQPSASASTQS